MVRHLNRDISLSLYQPNNPQNRSFFQDSREDVRKELLQCYGSMGLLDKNIFSRALNTNLPIEIARTLSAQKERMWVSWCGRGEEGREEGEEVCVCVCVCVFAEGTVS